MRLNFLRSHNSLTSAVTTDEIADFIVLSGPNGSGKSQLLEAIANGAMGVDGIPHPPQGVDIRSFSLGQLTVITDGPQTLGNFGDSWTNLQQFVSSQASAFRQQGVPDESIPENVRNTLIANRQLTAQSVARLEQESGKPLSEFKSDDYRRYAPMIGGVKDPFQVSLTEVFLSYHGRRNRNEFLQWQMDKKERADGTPLTDDEFIARFGPPPWELLGDTLALIGLDYTFVPPEGQEPSASLATRFDYWTTSPARP